MTSKSMVNGCCAFAGTTAVCRFLVSRSTICRQKGGVGVPFVEKKEGWWYFCTGNKLLPWHTTSTTSSRDSQMGGITGASVEPYRNNTVAFLSAHNSWNVHRSRARLSHNSIRSLVCLSKQLLLQQAGTYCCRIDSGMYVHVDSDRQS